MPLDESEWSYNGLTFGGYTQWTNVVCDPPLLPDYKADVIPMPGADGSWVYSAFKTDLAFTLSGEYGASYPGDAFSDFYETFAPAFAVRSDDQPLNFHLPGMSEYFILARPLKAPHFNLDRLLSLGYAQWTVLMEAADATWISA